MFGMAYWLAYRKAFNWEDLASEDRWGPITMIRACHLRMSETRDKDWAGLHDSTIAVRGLLTCWWQGLGSEHRPPHLRHVMTSVGVATQWRPNGVETVDPQMGVVYADRWCEEIVVLTVPG